MSRHKSVVAEKVRDLEQGRNTGSLLKPGEKWTVEEWLTHWLENIAAPFVKVNTLAGYRVAVNHHLIPGVGHHKLTELRPEHLEKLYQDMLLKRTKGGTLTKPATAHQVHRTVRTALNEAVRRGYSRGTPRRWRGRSASMRTRSSRPTWMRSSASSVLRRKLETAQGGLSPWHSDSGKEKPWV